MITRQVELNRTIRYDHMLFPEGRPAVLHVLVSIETKNGIDSVHDGLGNCSREGRYEYENRA